MSTEPDVDRIELLQGTLDLLILRTLVLGRTHGHAIAKAIERSSDQVLKVEQGSHPSPKMTLSADSDDYIALFTGKLDPMQAFMQGKLKLQGDLNLAMKMTQFFKMK